VRHRSNRIGVVFHGKVHITRAHENALPSFLLAFLSGTHQPLHDQVLGVVIAAAARAKLREDAAMLQKLAALAICLCLLAIVVPVLVREHEVGLAGECQQRDLVKYCVDPEALDNVVHITLVIIAACVLRRGKLDLDLLRRLEPEGFKEGEVGLVQVGAFLSKPLTFLGGDGDIGELCIY